MKEQTQEKKAGIIKSRKSQAGFFGLSFNMIFSIILIIFFIGSAFVALKFFLNYQKTSQIALFKEELQVKVNEAWNAESASFYFNSSLPSGIEYVCIVNLTNNAKNASSIENGIFDYIKTSQIPDSKNNLFLYAPTKNYKSNWAYIKHVNNNEKNPICKKVIKGIVSFKIERKFDKPLVYVS